MKRAGFGTIWEKGVSLFFRAAQIKPQRPSGRQCGPLSEEREMICIKKPKVFISFDLVFATLGVCAKEETLRDTNTASCVKTIIAIVVFMGRQDNYSKSWVNTPLREKMALGEAYHFWGHYYHEMRLFVDGQEQTRR